MDRILCEGAGDKLDMAVDERGVASLIGIEVYAWIGIVVFIRIGIVSNRNVIGSRKPSAIVDRVEVFFDEQDLLQRVACECIKPG